jgi:hypothetical protein
LITLAIIAPLSSAVNAVDEVVDEVELEVVVVAEIKGAGGRRATWTICLIFAGVMISGMNFATIAITLSAPERERSPTTEVVFEEVFDEARETTDQRAVTTFLSTLVELLNNSPTICSIEVASDTSHI